MKKSIRRISLAVTAVCATLLTLPAQAVQVSFSGSAGTDAGTVTGVDPLGNTWATTNGPSGAYSSFTMADAAETEQAFNPLNYSNGLGNFANSFKLTTNGSQQVEGFKGILLAEVPSGLINEFRVQEFANDESSWYSWDVSYGAEDFGFFQRILFTAPTGKQLSQKQNFKMNINFSGPISSTAGLSASWDDRAAPEVINDIPEPTSMALMGLGLVGLVGASRRKKGPAAQTA